MSAEKLSEFPKHLRAINLTIVLICLAILLAVVMATRPAVDRAIEQFNLIAGELGVEGFEDPTAEFDSRLSVTTNSFRKVFKQDFPEGKELRPHIYTSDHELPSVIFDYVEGVPFQMPIFGLSSRGPRS